LLGRDYHLGDLLWFTAVLAAFRRQVGPGAVVVGCPDRPISRILEHNPLIDAVLYGDGRAVRAMAHRQVRGGLVVHDLRVLPMAVAVVQQWGYRRPWLYYRDLWLEPRGQWLATFLRLGHLQETRPVVHLTEDDRATARSLVQPATRPIVLLAPHIGQFSLPLLDVAWRRLKEWGDGHWRALAEALREDGYLPVTLGAAGQPPIPGTTPAIGLPIRQVAGLIEHAAALVTVESGLWYVAAAFGTPLVIVPWWLPQGLDWIAPMGVPYRCVRRDQASVPHVLAQVRDLLAPPASHYQ
jgi:ADP-heptose:LPS heptosyltransferase